MRFGRKPGAENMWRRKMLIRARVIYPEFVIHTTPLERVRYDLKKRELRIYLDDEDEKRRCVRADFCLAADIVDFDCSYWKPKYFPEECFAEEEDMPFPQFKNHILQAQKSPWLKALKRNKKKGAPKGIKHFIVSLYETQIDFLARSVALEEYRAEEEKEPLKAVQTVQPGGADAEACVQSFGWVEWDYTEWDNTGYRTCSFCGGEKGKFRRLGFVECEGMRITAEKAGIRKMAGNRGGVCRDIGGKYPETDPFVSDAERSEWLRTLRINLKKKEPCGDLKDCRHFVLQTGETAVECCARGLCMHEGK